MRYSKVHKYTIAEYLYQFAFLFLIPIIQQLLFQPRSIIEIISTMGVNIAFVIILILWCVQEYKRLGYHAGEKYFYVKRGVFFHRRSEIPYDCIQSVQIKQGVISYFFGAIKLSLDTPAGRKKDSDISLTLSHKVLNSTLENIIPTKDTRNVYRSGTIRILLMSSSWANPATGFLLLAPFINRIGIVLGEEITDRLYSTMDLSLYLVAIGVPPIAAVVTYLLIFGWLIAMIVQLFRYSNFKVACTEDTLTISRGLLAYHKRIIKKSKINAIAVKQTLFMRLFKLYSAYVQTIGSGKESGDKSMLVAAARYHEMQDSLSNLVKLPIKNDNSIVPPRRAVKSFILLPLTLILAALLISIIMVISNVYNKVIGTMLLFSVLFITWWFFLRLVAHRTSGLSLLDEHIVVSGYNKLSLVSATVDLEKVQAISIYQNPFQRFNGLCKVRVYVFSETNEFFTVKNLELKEVKNLVRDVKI